MSAPARRCRTTSRSLNQDAVGAARMTQSFPTTEYKTFRVAHHGCMPLCHEVIKGSMGGPRPRKLRQPRQSPPGGLLTAAQAAAKLGISVKTLNGHVASGALRYVAIGHGTKRPRKMFTDADINE